MLANSPIFVQLRPLIHPMLVHFPIALLFASVALDWLGYLLKHDGLTRAGFYTLVLGAIGAGLAALSGPDAVGGDASVASLFSNHQLFASITVILAVVMFAVRFLATRGLGGVFALVYLMFTLILIASVSLTGYFGGELAYHHAIGITLNGNPIATGGYIPRPLVPAKPVTALVALLAIVGLGTWLSMGRVVAPRYFAMWWASLRQELSGSRSELWTLHRSPRGLVSSARPSADHATRPYPARGR